MAETRERSSPGIGAWANGKGAIIYSNGDEAGRGTLSGSPFAFSDNTLGTIFLFTISLILLIALLRNHARYRNAMERLAKLTQPQ